MANPEHLAKLHEGVEAWNAWREANPGMRPHLSEAKLGRTNLYGVNLNEANLSRAVLPKADLRAANLRGADLSEANLSEANLVGADLSSSDLSEANLHETNLLKANLSEAVLRGAYLRRADLSEADLRAANLSEANLSGAVFVETNLESADLTNCYIYGISAWNLKLNENTKQRNLVITRYDEPVITVDNLEVAQFIYLLLHNEKIRHVIDTITSKVVLILGRFTKDRMAVLDAIREELRQRDFTPVLFDFDKPASRDLTETLSTLAHMARFVIADITDAKSIPQELQRIVPDLPSVPVKPLLLRSQMEYAMFEHFKRYPWVLEVHTYDDQETLLGSLSEQVIAPAEAKAKELSPPKSRR